MLEPKIAELIVAVATLTETIQTLQASAPAAPAPAASGKKAAAPAAPEEAPSVTIDTVRAEMTALIAKKGADSAKALLGEFKAAKLSEVAAKDYAKLVSRIGAMLSADNLTD